MQSAEIDVKEYSYFAGNQWRKAADKKFFEVHEPYSGKLFTRNAAGSRADARAAVDAAAKAFPAWADSTPAERSRLFLKASEIVSWGPSRPLPRARPSEAYRKRPIAPTESRKALIEDETDS
jgi:delta 1-pyrroline-5-carboxylate dehydrogenase